MAKLFSDKIIELAANRTLQEATLYLSHQLEELDVLAVVEGEELLLVAQLAQHSVAPPAKVLHVRYLLVPLLKKTVNIYFGLNII